MEQGSVNERIKMLVEHFAKGNKSAFARAVGISNQSLAEILGARQSAPSFAALQKILTAFPQVRMEWFVFGRVPMLQDEEIQVPIETKAPEYATREQVQKLLDKQRAEQREMFEAYTHDLSEAALLAQVYRIGDVHPANKKLADRLSITADEARELVLSGRIRSTYVGKDDDRARQNGVSYLITEEAVREFLGDRVGTK